MAFVKESSRFYDPQTLEAVGEIATKSGGLRKPHIGDARKNGYKMSVTSYLRYLAAPGLEAWKRRNVLMAALTTSRLPNEPDEAFIDRIMADSEEEGKKAAESGTDCHKAIELYLQGKVFDLKWEPHINALKDALRGAGVELHDGQAERAFVTDTYGCRVDWVGNGVCVDFKTKERIDRKTQAYFSQCMQLAANGHAAGHWRVLINAFIGREDGLVHLHIWPKEDAERAWRAFQSLVSCVNEMEGL